MWQQQGVGKNKELKHILWWRLDVSFCHQGTEGEEEQSVGSYAAQQLAPPGRGALLHHHQPQPTGPRQEEDFPAVVSNRIHLFTVSSITDFTYSER